MKVIEADIGRHNLFATRAALEFAKRVVASHGRFSGEDVTALRQAGFTGHEISRIIAALVEDPASSPAARELKIPVPPARRCPDGV